MSSYTLASEVEKEAKNFLQYDVVVLVNSLGPDRPDVYWIYDHRDALFFSYILYALSEDKIDIGRSGETASTKISGI